MTGGVGTHVPSARVHAPQIGELPPQRRGRSHRCPASHGFSYVEMLVAVVLVGVAVIAILVGLRATVTAGRVGTERSQLTLWAQAGAEALHRAAYEPCGADPDAVRAHYQDALNDVEAPPALVGGSLSTARPAFLSIDPTTFTERWDEFECDPDFKLALLRVTATSPQGDSVEIEVIVDE